MTNIPVEYSSTIKDSIVIINYIFHKDTISSDTITYVLQTNRDFNPSYAINGQTKECKYVADQVFSINGETFPVFKYATNLYSIDGCGTRFWTPSLGIILTRSATWGNFRKLQTNNDSINRQINKLTELIYQDIEFYNGCTEKLELVPKDDADEFLKWKIKDIEKERQKKNGSQHVG